MLVARDGGTRFRAVSVGDAMYPAVRILEAGVSVLK